ncbi:DEAD/DEAH box helicase [Clostridium cibarium]|uniref:DEAD/DEAH box helicase n=1 Tax=Clostridium cibarium TaxID=2762247 RepID=A0ABR8PQT0_9CLOT|nr:DEAD/DEAH box helicase [Clostridium cibarium]MBD7910530.1 DEAD/DEAH box helicase [Clostridium cibarium]
MNNEFNRFKLSEDILKSLKALDYKKPTEVQESVINEALYNKDLIVKAQTGTGKTASFVIPLCEKVIWEENLPQVLILSPTRELALQIAEDVRNIGRFKRIKGIAVYGKSPFKDQARELKGKTHMVIGTPGRVLDHIDRGSFNTKGIRYLVIDEADEMLNMGFIKQVEGILRRIPKKRVTMLFSATLPEEIKILCEKYMNKPKDIEVKSEGVITDKIDHYIYRALEEEKLDNLIRLLIKERPETAVIFCKTKERVDLVYEKLRKKRFSIDKIHGGMLQKERIEAMERYKKGAFRILVATDVASRGIDVEGITHVVNFDVPVEKEAYVHRIGRTGRAGRKGKAITFVTSYEEKLFEEIQQYIDFKVPERNLKELELSKDEEIIGNEFLRKTGTQKALKAKEVNKGITKLYLNGGKKKKIRALDLVGTISNINGITSEDIGIIDIQDMGSYVEILNGKGKIVLEALQNMTVKGKKLRVEKAR